MQLYYSYLISFLQFHKVLSYILMRSELYRTARAAVVGGAADLVGGTRSRGDVGGSKKRKCKG